MLDNVEKALLEARNKLTTILSLAASKKKTTKWKACKRTCNMLLDRVNGILQVLQTGGNGTDACVTDDPIIIRRLYEDIVNYWRGELEK